MFTVTNVNTLVAWFTTVTFFIFSQSYLMSKKWRQYYTWITNQKYRSDDRPVISSAVRPQVFGIVWIVNAGFMITSMVLWTINYETCQNTYYTTVIALTLFVLVTWMSWGPLFIKMKRPGWALVTLLMGWAAAIAAFVLMVITVATSYPTCANVGRTEGIIAAVFYGLPILWVTYAAYLTYQFVQLPYKLHFMFKISVARKDWKDNNMDYNSYNIPSAPTAPDMEGDYYYGHHSKRRYNDDMYMMNEIQPAATENSNLKGFHILAQAKNKKN